MLTFDDGPHEYRWNGAVVPSVTQILKPLMSGLQFVDPEVLEAASAFGTAVHKACELSDLGTLDEADLDPALAPYLEGWKKFQRERRCKWRNIEVPKFHKQFRYAGTPDRHGTVDEWESVVDIKSGTALFQSVGPQLAAYERICADPELKGMFTMRRIAILLKPDGTYRMEEYKDPSDWSVFMSLITLRGWCAKHSVTPNFKD